LNVWFFRTVVARLEDSVPLLTDFDNLQNHFEWICDGSIKEIVKRKLEKELQQMERFLLSLGQEDLTIIIQTFASECDLHVDGSGSTYRWLGILRAADKYWRATGDFGIFRSELEGSMGSHPQLLFKIQDRYRYLTFRFIC